MSSNLLEEKAIPLQKRRTQTPVHHLHVIFFSVCFQSFQKNYQLSYTARLGSHPI